ncbi:MAG: hypothetical protein ACLUDU_09285 [Butyricimonas faecihominis]
MIPTLNAAAIAKSVKVMKVIELPDSLLANYDYKDRYLVSLSARYDGASNLGDDHKRGFFGISVGWNVHNEKFWTPLKHREFEIAC